jgi:hypothetical protein
MRIGQRVAGLAVTVVAVMLAEGLAFAQSPPSAEASAAAKTDAKTESKPDAKPDYCVERLLTPMRSMVGKIEPPAAADPPPAATATATSNATASAGATANALTVTVTTANAPATPAPTPPPADAALLGRLKELTEKSLQVRQVYIATLPDPIDSGLGYRYDATLQALRLGMEARHPQGQADLIRDRSWLPWNDTAVEEKDRRQSEECRRSTPGIILFRRSPRGATDGAGDGGVAGVAVDGSATAAAASGARGAAAGAASGAPPLPWPEGPEVTVLLLVGETPTTGLHPAAMERALRVADQLGQLATIPGRADAPVIPIIGPTFSGSADSLRQAIHRWTKRLDQPGAFRIISGAATASFVPRRLRTDPKAKNPAYTITFESTTLAASALECAYLGFLEHHLGVTPEHGALPNVAMLHESGTEFGSDLMAGGSRVGQPDRSWCGRRAEVDVSFPVNIAALRDAYEEADRKNAKKEEPAVPAARTQQLTVSLREKRRPQEVDAEPSGKTVFAQDMALTNMLSAISREGVKHAGIHATDVGDAIFLARKIREVAPDVRIAFFEADALFAEPEFHADLQGSLVISAYPFLGTDDFYSPDGAHSHISFETSLAEAIYNAMLAQRGFPATKLREYRLDPSLMPLPVWISVLGRQGVVPLAVRPSLDCNQATYGHSEAVAEKPEDPKRLESWKAGMGLCKPHDQDAGKKLWATFNGVRQANLRVDPDVTPPRLWTLVLALLIAGFFIDAHRQGRWKEAMAHPLEKGNDGDRQADLAMGRTKWELYAAIRTSVLALALIYMSAVHWIAFRTYPSFEGAFGRNVTFALAGVLLCGIAGLLGFSSYRWYVFVCDLRTFSRQVQGWREGCRCAPGAHWVGLGDPGSGAHAASISCAQMWTLVGLVGFILGGFFFALGYDVLRASDLARLIHEGRPVPATTLYVLRTLPLLNGVSPGAPILLVMAAVYVWAVGRMARLRLAHSLSRLAPPDAVKDLVSIPLSAVLYPSCVDSKVDAGPDPDHGFIRTEQQLINAIWRPITGPIYGTAMVVMLLLPAVVLALKPPHSLESWIGSLVLFGALALAAILVAATLLQLAQYWMALERLLKRTYHHRLGRAFGHVPEFARDTVDDLASRTPNDLLRMAACAGQFEQLMLAREEAMAKRPAGERLSELEEVRESLRQASDNGLERAAGGDIASAADAEEKLGQQLLVAGWAAVRILEKAWNGEWKPPAGNAPAEESAAKGGGGGKAEEKKPEEPDALAPVAKHFNGDELAWLRQAQTFAATVVALLVNRHVRQFRYFLYTLTATALLLLSAFASYPFEPHRLLLTGLWVVMGSVVFSGLWVFLELDRSELISRIAGTPVGELSLNYQLVIRVVVWCIVPLLSVAAAQFPSVASTLLRFAEPFTRALK